MTSRQRLVAVGQWLFLGGALVAAGWAWHDRGEEILDAVRALPPHAVAVAAVAVLGGLLATSVAWLRLLAALGHDLRGPTGRAVFFVGQLGKYLPGGVWSIGAHAHLARRHGVPVRITATASLAFLGLNLATASALAGAVVLVGGWAAPFPRGLGALLLAGGVVALCPPVVRAVLGRTAGIRPPGIDTGLVLRLAALMALTWSLYAAALVALVPATPGQAPGITSGWDLLPAMAAIFAAAYAVGVAVVLAPAGVGAREVTLAALLTPLVGGPAAVAATLLARLLHTGADLLLALVSWAIARSAARAARGARGARGERHRSAAETSADVHGAVAERA